MARQDITFRLIDEFVVRRMVREGIIKTPKKKKINEYKDKRWNEKQLTSKVWQGILNGDSIEKIALAMLEVVNNNEAAAVRNARTMVTEAENSGRLEGYKDLEGKGAVLKKVWIATPDDRTRESHLEIDGEEVDVDEAFSNGLMYPADPEGEPEEVYNCRCSMRTHIIGFRKGDGSISYIEHERDDTMHEKQIQKEKRRR